MNKKIISFIDYGPNIYEIKERDKNKICTSIKFNNGESFFYCNNKCIPFSFIKPPLAKKENIWIKDGMICRNCLKDLTDKYKINFEYKIPELYLNKGWNVKNIENFNNFSLINDLNSLNNESEKDNLNPEIIWFKNINFLVSLPIYWLKNFKLKTTLVKGNKKQGSLNGPDFIFKDIITNEEIGFEIVSNKWNFHESFKTFEAIKKYAKNNIFNIKNFNHRINEFKKIILDKVNKKYIKTDKLYLGIVVNNTLVDYEYYILELILNKFIKDQNIKLNGVFIL